MTFRFVGKFPWEGSGPSQMDAILVLSAFKHMISQSQQLPSQGV